MKKFILTSILSLTTVFVISAQVAPSACVNIQNNISYKNRSSQLEDGILKGEVITLQNFLAKTRSPITKRPYLTQTAFLTITPGNFDEATASATRAFQFAERLVRSRSISPSFVILGPATRAKIAQLSGCTVVTTAPKVQAAAVNKTMARLTLAPGATAVVTDNPTLALEYDSSNSEASLVARATVSITAGYSDLYLYNVSAANALAFINSDGNRAEISNTETSGTLVSGNAVSITGASNGLPFYKIPANETATFVFVAKKNPKQMFAGAYTASVQQMDAYTSTNALQEEYVSVPVAPNTSRQVTIVGEVSPYISSAAVDATGLVRLTGARFDLPGNLYMINGVTSITNSKGDANNISFNASEYNLSAGYHTVQILNPRTGNSNTVSFEVATSFTGTASAYIMSSPSPTLTLKYNSQNKEASLVYEAYVNVTATGGDIKINSGNDYSKDGYTFNIVTTNAGNQQAVASSSPVAQFAAGLTKGNGLIVPSGNRATYKVTQVYNVKQSFPGSYKAAIQLYDPTYTRNLLGGNTSNAVTIIGETSPYITAAVIDGNNNVVLTGVRFHPTGNTIISGDQRLNLPSTEGGTKIVFPLRSLGITNTSGYFNVQVSHPTEGLSNSAYVQFGNYGQTNPITEPATNISPTGALLNMVFDTLGTSYNTYFSWGENQSTLSNELKALNGDGYSSGGQNFTGLLSGLISSKAYYYQAKAKNNNSGEVLSGEVLSFMTLGGTTAPAPTLTFTGNNSVGTTTVTSGQPVYLRWSSTNALLCNAGGSWSGMKATSSVEVVYPQQTTVYTLSCGGVAGEANQITRSVTVLVSNTTTAPTITLLSPNGGETLKVGDTYRITWDSKNVDRVNLGWTSGPGSLTWLQDTGNNTPSVNIPNIGYYDWKVSAGNMISGTSRSIKINLSGSSLSANSPASTDESNNFFTVVNSTPTTCPNGQTWNGTQCAGTEIPIGTTPNASAYFVSTPTLTMQKDSFGKDSLLKAEYVVNVYAPTSNVTVTGALGTAGMYVFRGRITNTATQAITSNFATTTVKWGAGVTTGSVDNNTITIPVGNRATVIVTMYFDAKTIPAGNYIGNVFLSPIGGASIAPSTPTNQVTVVGVTPTTPTVSMSSGGGSLTLGSESKLAEFTVSASTNGDIGIKSFVVAVGVSALTNPTITNFRLADSGNQTIALASVVGNGLNAYVTFTTPYQIQRGSSKTFVLYGVVNGTRSTEIEYFTTASLPPAYFIWNDSSTNSTYTADKISSFPFNLYRVTGRFTSLVSPAPTVNFSASNGMSSVNSPSSLEVTPTQRVTLTWSSTGMSSCTPSGTDANNPVNAGNWTGTTVNTNGTKTFTSPWFSSAVTNPAPVTYTISCTPVLGGTPVTKSIEVKKAVTAPTTPPVAGINKAIDITVKNVTTNSMDIVATFSSTIPGSQVFIIHGTDSELSAVKCTTSCGSDPARIICPSGCGIPNPVPVIADGTNRPYTFTMTGLTPNTKYTYKAYIRDPQGNLVEGTWSLQNAITPTGVVANCTTGDIASLDSFNNIVPISGGGITQADVDYVRTKSGSTDARADLDKSGTVTAADISRIRGLLGTCPAVSTTSSGARIISSGVTFVANSSPVAQYVLGDSTLAIAKFNIKTSNNLAGAVLKDLVFTVPANTISSITVNGKVASVVGTTAALYDLGVTVPGDANGLDLNVSATLTCANSTGGCSGISSSVVSLALSSLSYRDGQVTQPAITTTAKTPNHILVVSKPTLTLNQSSSGTFGNGVAKIGEFTVAADASGNIELKQIPITLAVSGGLSITPGTVELRDKDGNSRITGTNALSGSGNFTFSSPRIISRGTSETYTVYASITGVSGAAGTQTATFSLGNKSSFIWNDSFGNAQNLKGDLIFNYPSQSQTSTAVAAAVQVEKPVAMCDYSAAQTGCTWVAGPNYTASNQCGKVLQCAEVVPVRKLNTAQFISQNVPGTMIAGQTYSVSVTMKNTGNTTWTQATHKLGSQNPQDNTTWGGRAYLATGESIAPGAQKTFTFNVRAPANVSSSNFQWRMVEEGVEWFGDSTSNITVTVTQPAPTQQLVSYTPTSSSGPAIGVLSPRGGETYKVGSTITMKWKFENVNEGNNSTVLQIHDNSAPYKSIYTGYASNPTVNGDISVEGTQTFTIPSGTTPGSYALYISNADGWSETGYFNIVP